MFPGTFINQLELIIVFTQNYYFTNWFAKTLNSFNRTYFIKFFFITFIQYSNIWEYQYVYF